MSKQRTDEDIVLKIAHRIKQLRREKNITQEVFVFDTNINIGRIESGKSNITMSTLVMICDYLGVSLQDFFKDL